MPHLICTHFSNPNNIHATLYIVDPITFERRDFYQTPTEKQQWDWWQEGFLQWGAVFFPVQIQRVYSAATVKGVSMGAWATLAGPWVAQFGFIFMGIMGVSMLGQSCPTSDDPETCMTPDSPFSAILEELMDLGGFPMAAAIILQCSALAAIMSTTDSILISISQIITTEVVYPLKPQASPNQVNWFGRCVSACVAALALIVGLAWKGSIVLLIQLNEPFLMQMVPAFMLGLLAPKLCHPWSLAVGAVMGMLFTVIMEIIGTNNTDLANYGLRPGLSTFFINCVCIILLETTRIGWARLKSSDSSSLTGEEDNEDDGSSDENSKADGKEKELDSYENIVSKRPFSNRPKWDIVSVCSYFSLTSMF